MLQLRIGLVAVGVTLIMTAPQTSFAKEPGVSIKVNPQGTFYEHTEGNKGDPPTKILLGKLGVTEGDYIGVRVFGTYTFKTEYDEIEAFQTSAVFEGKDKTFIKYAEFGNGLDAENVHCANTRADFLVMPNVFIYRVPQGATSLLLAPYQCVAEALSDPDKDYIVRVTRPNNPEGKKQRGRKPHPVASHGDDGLPTWFIHSVLRRAAVDPLVPRSASPLERNGAKGLAFDTIPPVPDPQYRGWYKSCKPKGPCWAPIASRYGKA